MGDYLRFRKMITPVIVEVLFWLGVVACVIGGLILIASGAGRYSGRGGAIISGILLLVLGPLGVRIWCELLIVLFRMLDFLREISEKLGRSA